MPFTLLCNLISYPLLPLHILCTLLANLGILNYLRNMTFLLALVLGLCLYFSLKTQLRATFSWKLPRPSAPHPPEWARWPSHSLPELTLFLLSEHLSVLLALTIYLSPTSLGIPQGQGSALFVLASLEPITWTQLGCSVSLFKFLCSSCQ